MNKKNQEKRSADRKSYPLRVVVEMDAREVEGRSDSRMRAEAVDIGPGGLGLKSSRIFHFGDILKIFLPLGEQGVLVPVFSEVRWSRAEAGDHRLGLQFLG